MRCFSCPCVISSLIDIRYPFILRNILLEGEGRSASGYPTTFHFDLAHAIFSGMTRRSEEIDRSNVLFSHPLFGNHWPRYYGLTSVETHTLSLTSSFLDGTDTFFKVSLLRTDIFFF